MRVIINFKIDKLFLKSTISYLLILNEKVNKKSIIDTMKDIIYLRGHSAIDFSEIENVEDEDELEKLVHKYSYLIGK